LKKFSMELLVVYLIFIIVPILGGGFSQEGADKTPEKKEIKDIWKKPEYSVVIPKNSSEVLMEREGNYVYSGRDMKLTDLSVAEKKKVFINLIVPAIDMVEKEVQWRRELVGELRERETLTEDEKTYLEKLFTDYRVRDRNIDRLLSKMVMPPKSLIISQAALESGWGTSRFFTEGNNIFGVWSYNENEPRIPALVTREGGYTAYLKSYGDLKGSVEDYVVLLSKNTNYSELRAGIRAGESSIELAEYLTMYSEIRGEYVKRVQSVIRSNGLKEFD